MKDFLAESGPEETQSTAHSADENFAELFEASQQQQEIKEGEVVDGTVVAVTPDYATVDIGYKCEGLVPIQEFKDAQALHMLRLATLSASTWSAWNWTMASC